MDQLPIQKLEASLNPPTLGQTSLPLMLERLQEEENERRLSVASLAAYLLRVCAGGGKGRERAQAAAHEALRCAKSGSRQKSSSKLAAVHSETVILSERSINGSLLKKRDFPKDTPRFSESEVDRVVCLIENGEGKGVGEARTLGLYDEIPCHAADQRYPCKKADRRRDDLLARVFQATKHHMEPEWAAVELLSYFEEELNPNRGDAQNASQAMLNAIRVLPAPVAGDVFVTCAARGNIGVILFYSEEGLPIDHAHSTLKYQALHAAVEFGHLDSARLLVALGAKVDARGGLEDRSPLFLAALAKRWDACSWLLEVGASKNVRDKRGLTAYQAMTGSSDPEVTKRAGMLTDPPQRIVSISCRGIAHNSLTLVWSQPLRSYDEEVFVGYLMEWRPMYPRRICPAHSRHLAEKVRPPKKRGKKAGRAGWQDNVVRPSTAGEMSGTSQAFLPQANSMGRGQGSAVGAALRRRPNTGGGETAVDAQGHADPPPWKSREVENYPMKLTGLHPAMNYMVRVSARTLAGLGSPSREALFYTRFAPPSAPKPAPKMVSATPSSITVGWLPPKYENGDPIVRYEIQRLVLDQNHPSLDAGRLSTSVGTGSLKSTTASASTSISTNSTTNSDENESNTTTTTDPTTNASSSVELHKAADGITIESGTFLPPIQGINGENLGGEVGSGPESVVGEDRKQVDEWIGQKTEKMAPFYTASGLPMYCRAIFRIRAGNAAGWGPWSPSSDSLKAQDIILAVKRGATHMLMRWFNKPEGDVLLWELSRRVFKYGVDFRGDNDNSWVVCSRDIPGLNGGESTFRCKGLMPGTEYQFRLRAFSDGSWQSREESVVSSPFKTICSPPDAPPRCPRSRQLDSDPVAAGGLVDTGALLDAAADSGAGNYNFGSDVLARTSSCRSRTGSGTGMVAAVARGKARAEAEWNAKGRATKDGRNSSDERGIGVLLDERTNNNAGNHCGQKMVDTGVEEKELEGNEAVGGYGGVRKRGRTSIGDGNDMEPPFRSDRQDCADREFTPAAAMVAKALGSGSSSIALEWDAGCTNGAVITNYEVWGLADAIQGESAGSVEWTLVATTEACPKEVFSGLREARSYRFKVRALNSFGWSEFGPHTAPLIINPLQTCEPPELVERGVTWLSLKLQAPPGVGLVLGFELEMCRSRPGMSYCEGTWEPVRGERGSKITTRDNFLVLWDLRSAAGYRFKVRARTVFGWTPAGAQSGVYYTIRRF